MQPHILNNEQLRDLNYIKFLQKERWDTFFRYLIYNTPTFFTEKTQETFFRESLIELFKEEETVYRELEYWFLEIFHDIEYEENLKNILILRIKNDRI